MTRPFDFGSFFQGFLKGDPTCSHLLSARMPDGVYFCPSCKAKSGAPLKEVKPGANRAS